MTFLMHAASSGRVCECPSPNSERHKSKKDSGEAEGASDSNRQRATSRHNAVTNPESRSSDLERDPQDDALARNTAGLEPSMVDQTGPGGEATDPSISREKHPQDPEASVVIFKTAFNFYTDFLWKEQVWRGGVLLSLFRSSKCGTPRSDRVNSPGSSARRCEAAP